MSVPHNVKLLVIGVLLVAVFGTWKFFVLEKFPINAFAVTKNTIKGELEVFHTDNPKTKTSTYTYYLKTDGKKIQLQFIGQPPQLLSGSQIEVTGGTVSNNTLLVDATNKDNFKVVSEKKVKTVGTKSLAIVLVNFQDNPTYQPFTINQVRATTFTDPQSVKTYYKETSFNKTNLVGRQNVEGGDVFGWYTVPFNHLNCQLDNWPTAADSIAQSQGIDLSQYSNVMYVFSESDCPWWGGAYIGGRMSFLNGVFPYELGVVAHELGHNFGAAHSSSYNCLDSNNVRVPISDKCTYDEYGDPFDVMGGMSPYHTSDVYKEKLQFFDSSNVQNVLNGGMYTLYPIEAGSHELQSIRIPIGFDSYGYAMYYFLEYRQPFGYDNFNPNDPVVNGVTIRMGKLVINSDNAFLIDTTADTSTFLDSALTTGHTFTDPMRNITIRTISTSNSRAVVQIDMPVITPTFTPTPTVPMYMVSGRVMNIGTQRPLACPSDGYPGISFVNVRIMKDGVFYQQVQSLINGIFRFAVPTGNYDVCLATPFPNGLKPYCATQYPATAHMPNEIGQSCSHISVLQNDFTNIGLVLGQ